MRCIFSSALAFSRSLFAVVLLFAISITLLKSAAAQPKLPPRPVFERQTVPKKIQARAPKTATNSVGMRSGDYFLHWYRIKSHPYLSVWEARGKNTWRFVRVTPLPDGAYLPEDTPFVPNWGGPYILHLTDGTETETEAPTETDWLCPSRQTGPILIAGSMYNASFYVFPHGFNKPVYVWSGGSGAAGWNCSYYFLGPTDERGQRTLIGRYHWDTMDEGEDTDANYRWAGTGWVANGPEHTYHYTSNHSTEENAPAPPVAPIMSLSDVAASCSTSVFGLIIFSIGAFVVFAVSTNGAEQSDKPNPRALLIRTMTAYALPCVAIAYLADKSGSVAGGCVVNGCVALLTLLCVKTSVRRLRAYYRSASAPAHADIPNP